MFAELLASSSFSFLRGASHPWELVLRAQELGLSAIAICDRDGLYGAARAYTAARDHKQRYITGAELTLASSVNRRSSRRAKKSATELVQPTLALLCENHQGYQNLCRLLTLAHADLPKGESELELEWLESHAEGLWALIPAPRYPGDRSTPDERYLRQVKAAFGERATIAMYRHFDGFDDARLAWLQVAAKKHDLRVIASARPLFHEPTRKQLCDVLHAIRLGTTLDRAGTLIAGNAEAYLRSEKEMLQLFSDHPAWVAAAGELAQTLTFQLNELRYQFPCSLEVGESADEKLERLTWQGLASRYPLGAPESVREQVVKELALIKKMNVARYFLSTWEVVEMAREKRILCQGRGSAANSAVCFALGVTAVDPTHTNLLFERFLSEERKNEPPDIDVDFEHERREEVIQEIYRRYGRERAAMVSEVICYRGKSALREVGKVFGLSLEQIDRLSGTITHWDTAEVSRQRLCEMGFDAADGRIQQILVLAREMAGYPRHLSIHVGGFVLSAAPLHEVAPVEPGRMVERTVVPWDKDDLETLGFFKIDVLGLGMLTAIRKTLTWIHAEGDLHREVKDETARGYEEFDPIDVLARVPQKDTEVYEMISRADTVGVFQIESRAQMAMLPRLKPRTYYDLVIEVAIVRPGPIQGGMVHPYLRRRNGEERHDPPHPSLARILERTLGVPLFQEQVMQIAIEGAGYSGGEADRLRRDMAAWKKTGQLDRHEVRLLDGFEKNGISREFGKALFQQIRGFGDYGFPESHAASFALLVYASSWQKAHYPAHFACALLNSQPMGFYSAATIIHDAQRHGVEVRDVDVTQSDWDSTLEPAEPNANSRQRRPRALRLGLRQVKGLSKKCAERLMFARVTRPFASLEDATRRAALREDEVERLAEAGAFETLLPGRRQALWRARAPRAAGLFEDKSFEEPEVSLPKLRPAESLSLDYQHKALSVGDHPMRHFRQRLGLQVLTAEGLKARNKGEIVSVAGVVICRQQPGTASGVVFITLEDETGFANLILWRAIYEKFRLPARHSSILLAHGEVERQVRPDGSNLVLAERGETPVIHLIVRSLSRLDVPGRDIQQVSRDFH
ncbi:MAG TPA: error-prone DNA polymerase [Polyangiaceae bacterium]|nr:error-prone DNA polymerase [Polyangiaceae bacterium]